MKKFVTVLFMLIGLNTFGYSIDRINNDIHMLFDHYGLPRTQNITIDGKQYELDWSRLLILTAGVESNFGQDNYSGRVAKTFMQIEEDSYKHYLKVLPATRDKVAEYTNISQLKDSNAIAIAYVFYLSKMFHHSKWINLHKDIFYKSNKDVEYFVYKLYFNSIKGKSTYSKWIYRENWLLKNVGI